MICVNNSIYKASSKALRMIDWETHWAKLNTSENVFALVAMAQLHAKRLKVNATRKDVKVTLIRLLYERSCRRDQVVRLFNIIDWMLQLPKALESEFVQAFNAIQEEKHMPYVNTIERLGIEKGRQQALRTLKSYVLRRGIEAPTPTEYS